MADLTQFLQAQNAMIGLRSFEPGGALADAVDYEWPSTDFVLDGSVFAFWWMGEDPGGHAVRVTRVEDIDHAVLLHHDAGAVEVSSVYAGDQRRQVEAWRALRDADAIRRYLELAVEQVKASPAPDTPAPRPLWRYDVMIEWRRLDDDPDQWAVVGAWAANASEIAFVALPMYSPIETEFALASVADPLETFDYYWRGANGYTAARGKIDPLEAVSAIEAARQAAIAHQGDSLRTE